MQANKNETTNNDQPTLDDNMDKVFDNLTKLTKLINEHKQSRAILKSQLKEAEHTAINLRDKIKTLQDNQ